VSCVILFSSVVLFCIYFVSLIYSLFTELLGTLDYISKDSGMVYLWPIGKDMDIICLHISKVLSRHMLGGPEKKYVAPQSK
jgi:hypothetical protein